MCLTHLFATSAQWKSLSFTVKLVEGFSVQSAIVTITKLWNIKLLVLRCALIVMSTRQLSNAKSAIQHFARSAVMSGTSPRRAPIILRLICIGVHIQLNRKKKSVPALLARYRGISCLKSFIPSVKLCQQTAAR